MNGPAYTNRVREDFDRIAELPEAGSWDHNAHYHPFLLKQLLLRLDEALEVGCGTGAFARLLAQRCNRVVAVDLSPRMIEVARERSREYTNVEYLVADASRWEFPQERFDSVVSIVTLHHLSLGPMLAKLRDALRPGGILLLLDLYRASTVTERLVGTLALPPASKAIRLWKTGSLTERQSPEVRRAWDEHGTSDVYPTLGEVRSACEMEIEGAEVRRHLLWRYMVLWRKPL